MEPLPSPPEWTRQAACQGQASRRRDPWHPDPARGAGRWAAAIAVCATCPVISECRDYAIGLLPAGQVQGVFGGLTPAELRAEAKAAGRPLRRRARHGTRARYVGRPPYTSPCRCETCCRANARGEAARRLWVPLPRDRSVTAPAVTPPPARNGARIPQGKPRLPCANLYQDRRMLL